MDALRVYLHGQPTWYTTPFCLYEALGRRLRQRPKIKIRLDRITEDQYHNAGLSSGGLRLPVKAFTRRRFLSARQFFRKYRHCVENIQNSISSDAFQNCECEEPLLLLALWRFSNGACDRRILDSAKAAHLEGLKVAQLKGKPKRWCFCDFGALERTQILVIALPALLAVTGCTRTFYFVGRSSGVTATATVPAGHPSNAISVTLADETYTGRYAVVAEGGSIGFGNVLCHVRHSQRHRDGHVHCAADPRNGTIIASAADGSTIDCVL